MRLITTTLMLALAAGTLSLAAAPVTSPTVSIDFNAKGHAFPHFWEKTFGSGRAVLSLRESYRNDLRAVKTATDFEYIRFHGIFHDEVGLYHEDKNTPVYNFSYVDQIYDGLLQNKVRPYVELSFMPKDLSVSPPVLHPFWYKPVVSPPKDWTRWEGMIEAFATHLVARYGIEEVSKWPFEVWNEPNIDFWAGNPKESTYYQLYDHTVAALKRVSPRLSVGGPSTAQAAWVDRFIKHCASNNIPVDFISTHVYANDSAEDVFGTHEKIARQDMVGRAVQKVHDQVAQSDRPGFPIYFSEYNASYANEVNVTDSTYMGPWLAGTIRQCDGLVDTMAYWCFSDVFEEGGVVQRPFYGGFGLIAAGGIPKPTFNIFRLLHKLGTVRVPADSEEVLATRTADGRGVVALWNYADVGAIGAPETFHLQLSGKPYHHARYWRVDTGHGDSLAAWREMGSPDAPSRDQQAALRKAGELSAPEETTVNGSIDIPVPPHGLVVLELTP